MNRRGFLSALISAGAAAAIDPERLLWMPGQKLISIPRPEPLYVPEFRMSAVDFHLTPEMLWSGMIDPTIFYGSQAAKSLELQHNEKMRSNIYFDVIKQRRVLRYDVIRENRP